MRTDKISEGQMVANAGESSGQANQPGGAGSRSLAGYEYQIDVSVWLALDLVLANKMTHELVLEPATEEDIEGDIAENEAGRVTSTASLDSYRLIVQAKLRGGDAWTVSSVKALLKHGEVRASAAQRLEDPSSRYLLITSAGLNGRTRGLRVRRAGSWPKAEDIPPLIKSALPEGAAGRVAVIGNQDEERLATDIKMLLTASFRVPHARLEECRRALREEARMRIGGAGGGRWTRPQLERLIRRHDGYIASSPELDNYVHPTNWVELRSAMRDSHAALIIGQSGTGKTMATRKLYEELRELVPGLTRVPITLGPEQLRVDRTEPPVFYDIEDPWGRYDFDPKSRPWNDQLAQFFAEARHDRMIVATSRLDVAQSAGALDTVKPWLIGLEAEHYEGPERRRLYRTRIDALPRKLQVLAKEAERSVLAELATPLEIQKFFDALPMLDNEKRRHSAALVAEAIKRAHQNSIERTVVDQVEERKDIRAAAVVWGLLKTNDKLSLRVLRQIEEELAEQGPLFERGVSPLVSFFVAARNFRQVETTITYYHPRVEAGIEQALLRDRLVARRTLRLLIDILVSPDGPDEVWGVAASARLLLATNRTPDLKPEPSTTAQAKVDAWLAEELAKGGKLFEKNLDLAAAAGSQNSNVAEVARFLLYRPNNTFGLHYWEPLERDEAWYARMRGDQSVKALVDTFIRDLLPRTRTNYQANFVTAIERLAHGLTPAYLAAAADAVYYGVTNSSDTIAEGALNDINGYEAIVDSAVLMLIPSEVDSCSAEETRLAITNGEYSEDYAEHLADNEDGWTANEFLEAYVHRVRKVLGWRHLAEHKHRNQLLFYWLRAIAKDEAPKSEEVVGAFMVGYDSKDEDDLWYVLTKVWVPDFKELLIERILKGHPEAAVRIAALTCLVECVPGQIAMISQTIIEQASKARLVELAIELGEVRHTRSRFDGSRHGEAAGQAVAELPQLVREISEAAFALETKNTPVLSDDARQFLAAVSDASEIVRVFRIKLEPHVPIFVPDDVCWLLANTTDVDRAVEAIDAAIRHRMAAEILAGLTHRFAHVVARALKATAAPLPPPLPEPILALAWAKGSPVRQALVELLDAKPHTYHLPALLHLAKDKWSRRASYYGEEDDYPIAQAAVAAIIKLGAIDKGAADELYRVAIDTSDTELQYEIFDLLALATGLHFQEQLFELAVNPGRQSVRINAAHALLMAHAQISPKIVTQITPKLLEPQTEGVVSRLLLLSSLTCAVDDVIKSAKMLAANDKRRVLVLLAIWILQELDRSAAERIACMLPTNHPGVMWALAGAKGKLDDTVLDDLGDPLSVNQVLQFMLPKGKKC